MRSSSRPRRRSLVRTALWIVFGPFVAVAGLLLFVFGFALLAVVMQLAAVAFRHAGF